MMSPDDVAGLDHTFPAWFMAHVTLPTAVLSEKENPAIGVMLDGTAMTELALALSRVNVLIELLPAVTLACGDGKVKLGSS
jgi:hypothetical protein